MILDPTQTIVALSTAARPSVRGVVRLSGPAAVAAAGRVFAPGLADTPGFRRVAGELLLGRVRLPAAAMVFRGPRSYTGEDLVELHVPGSPPLLGRLIEMLLADSSVRAAGPGEFTARAFLHGRLDLSQAEGVAAVIAGRSAAQLRAARQLLDGAVSAVSRGLRARLIDLLAELEAGIDFVEEDIRFITADRVGAELADIGFRLADCLARRREAEVLDVRPTVVLVGRPNVGKSSLLNALAGAPRAIVSDRAGTTRDPVSALVDLGGIEVTLLDTAGVSADADAGRPGELAQSATARRRGSADLTLLVFDGSVGWTAEDESAAAGTDRGRSLRVANKADLVGGAEPCGAGSPRPSTTPIRVSARTGEGLEELRRRVAEMLNSADGADADEGRLALNARHVAALTAAGEAVSRAAELNDIAAPPELIALELRDAAWHIGTVAGEVVADDILGRIFAKFCVGK
jgi:tRNA modification GTPase